MTKKYLLGFFMLVIGFAITSVYAGHSIGVDPTVDYSGPNDIQVYRGANCECCKQWIERMRLHQFHVTDIVVNINELAKINLEHNIPLAAASCLTAFIDGYIVVGHIPVDLVKRLVTERPNIRGVALPIILADEPGMRHGGEIDMTKIVTF